jgi:soluble lytic murein transglycosylase-like protein
MPFISRLLLAGAFLTLTGFAPAELQQKIQDAARRASLDPKLVAAIIRVESNFKPRAVSPKGAMGLMQVMPKTAEASDITAPYHTVNNLMGACEYLRSLINRYRGNLKLALAAYNAGPGNVERHGGIPPFTETRQYVRKVLGFYDELKKKK